MSSEKDIEKEVKRLEKKFPNKKKKKPGRKPKKKPYFGIDVQEAIVRYNDSTDDSERNIIYRDEIHKAFDKLAENIINTFKFTYFDYGFEDIKHEVVAFMVVNLHKYDHTKGSKAFSYFSVVAKNYLILHNNANYKRYKSHDDIKVLDLHKHQDNKEGYDDFINQIIQYFDYKIPLLFKKKKDLDVAYAIIELIKRKEEIENFNKKALYILIREMTDVETTYITKVTNVFKSHYKKILREYEQNGVLKIPPKNPFF